MNLTKIILSKISDLAQRKQYFITYGREIELSMKKSTELLRQTNASPGLPIQHSIESHCSEWGMDCAYCYTEMCYCSLS